MIQKILILSSIIALTQQTAISNGCGPFCVSCNQEGICQACHMYSLIAGRCDTSKPAPKNCEMAAMDEDGVPYCRLCKEGFAIQVDTQNNASVCVEGHIPNCFEEIIFENSQCYSCKNGTPSYDNDKCETELADNCVIGTGNPGNKACLICKKGYVSLNDECIVSKIEGCGVLNTDEKTCMACDFIDGYYAIKDNMSCQKI